MKIITIIKELIFTALCLGVAIKWLIYVMKNFPT